MFQILKLSESGELRGADSAPMPNALSTPKNKIPAPRELRGADSAPPPNALSTPKNKIPAPSEEQGVVQVVFT